MGKERFLVSLVIVMIGALYMDCMFSAGYTKGKIFFERNILSYLLYVLVMYIGFSQVWLFTSDIGYVLNEYGMKGLLLIMV